MLARFNALRATLAAGTRVVVLGHHLHVARDSDALRYGVAPFDRDLWTSLGTRIERDRPGSLWVSWLLYGHGARYAPSRPEGRSTVELRPDSLEAHLAQSPGDSLVVVAQLPPDSVVDHVVPFGSETSGGAGAVRSSVDAIVFLQNGSAP